MFFSSGISEDFPTRHLWLSKGTWMLHDFTTSRYRCPCHRSVHVQDLRCSHIALSEFLTGEAHPSLRKDRGLMAGVPWNRTSWNLQVPSQNKIRHRGVLGLLHFFMASWSKIIVLKHHLFLGGQHWFRFEAKMFDLWQSDRPIRGQTGEHMAFFFGWTWDVPIQNIGERERERQRERG